MVAAAAAAAAAVAAALIFSAMCLASRSVRLSLSTTESISTTHIVLVLVLLLLLIVSDVQVLLVLCSDERRRCKLAVCVIFQPQTQESKIDVRHGGAQPTDDTVGSNCWDSLNSTVGQTDQLIERSLRLQEDANREKQ